MSKRAIKKPLLDKYKKKKLNSSLAMLSRSMSLRVSNLTRVQLAQIQQIGVLKQKIVAILKEKHGGHEKPL